jgi:hypothetical protein
MRVRIHRISKSKKRASRAHKSAHTPWIGIAISSVRRFFVRRKTSIVNTRLNSNAEKVTLHLIGGRVTATKSTSAVNPALRSLTAVYTPKSPRTQVTICGAPKAIAIPKIAAMHHAQEIRFAIAMAPKTMTRIMATGVSQARMFVCSAFAPVKNGEACANASPGTRSVATTAETVVAGLLRAENPQLIVPPDRIS